MTQDDIELTVCDDDGVPNENALLDIIELYVLWRRNCEVKVHNLVTNYI